ncbi:MAG: hypothetical protein Q7J98_02535 [Kiritimatiellia bacterium]|nr:hypothetical protein [Kiritimatiellia bacterium]
MKKILPVLLLATVILSQSAAENSTSYAPAEPYFLSTNSPTCFFANYNTSATYSKFSPDGQYIRITKQHMGVWPFDNGTWAQSADGIITLISTNLCADIICEPLEIRVGRHDRIGRLPELQRKIAEYLNSNVKDEYANDDLTGLAVGEYWLNVEIDWLTQRKSVTHAEMQALLNAVKDFLNKPSLQNERLMPLSYKGKVFLVNLNKTINRDYRVWCKKIAARTNSQTTISHNDFMVTEAQFSKGTGKPYPFKIYKWMNILTGAE